MADKITSASKGAVKLTIVPSKAVGAACVSVGFAAKGDGLVLKAMCSGSHLCSISELHQTAVFCALVKNVHYRLEARPGDAVKNKYLGLHAGLHGGEGIISVLCYPNKSAVRRVLGVVLDGLNPGKLYSGYSRACRKVGETPDKAYFGYCADELAKSIKGNVDVLISGRVKSTAKDAENILGKSASKLNKITAVKDKKEKPSVHKAVAEESKDFTKLKCDDGVSAYLSKYLIKSTLRGACVVIDNKDIYVDISGAKLDKLKDKDTVARYAKNVGSAVDKKGSGFLVFYAANKCCGSVDSLIRDSKKSWTESAIKSAAAL